MDKITLVKMLLASKEENKKLHDKLESSERKLRSVRQRRKNVKPKLKLAMRNL